MSNLTKIRLEAIIEAIGQRLACASETDISREEYEKARDWAQAQLDRRRVVKPIPPGPWVDPHQRGAEPNPTDYLMVPVSESLRTDPDAAP